ncbi:ACT domain-containing protein [Lactobacillus kalixensis]|uniref:UPF0237 protein FC46_GL000785 n=1 Tax=Lactobacillus kalixensis DSM 16043 TaxID=1423763 RepID=A0A0R1UJJ3_9LACO|nr:ACT domain-containing protein [Lactobacillus kalixensis]KRL89515.1 hypothetical protein FC46_GL000785 [Lactobacillus kalixensis DSM 16043]
MKAILTVVGKDHTGIVAKVSSQLAKDEINILDISQTIMDTNFVMMMSVELPENINFKKVSQELTKLGNAMNLEINLRNEELFDAMHSI